MKINIQMTMKEFEKHCSYIRPENIIFYTSHQEWRSDSLAMSLVFDKMNIRFNPNRVLLATGEQNSLGRYDNTLKISRIKYILFTERAGGVDCFTLVCGNSKNDNNDIQYKISIKGLRTWDKFEMGKF